MLRQLIRAGKLVITAIPAAGAWLLPCVGAEINPELGTLEVRLLAALEIAKVVFPSGDVYLRGTVLAGGDEDWSRCQRQ